MRRILWIVLLAFLASLIAMVVHTPFRDTVVGFFKGTILEPVVSGLGAISAAITTSPSYTTYVGPYLFWYGTGFGIIALIITQRIFWPKIRRTIVKPPLVRPLQHAPEPSPPQPILTATKAPAPIVEPAKTEQPKEEVKAEA